MSVQKFCVTTWRTERQQESNTKNQKQSIKCLSCLDYPPAYLPTRACFSLCLCIQVPVCACILYILSKIGLSIPPCFQCSVFSPYPVFMGSCIVAWLSSRQTTTTRITNTKTRHKQQFCCSAPLLLPNMAAHELKLNLKRQRCCQWTCVKDLT